MDVISFVNRKFVKGTENSIATFPTVSPITFEKVVRVDNITL